MRTMAMALFAAAVTWAAQDDGVAEKVRDLVGRLPGEKAEAALIELGKPALSELEKLASNGRIRWASAEVPAAIRRVIAAIRGWREAAVHPSGLVKPDLQMSIDAHQVVRTKKDADRLFDGWEKAFPGLDWEKEMILLILPDGKLQTILVKELKVDDEKKTLTVVYALQQNVGCGNTLRIETAAAIAVKRTDHRVVFSSRDEGPVRGK